MSNNGVARSFVKAWQEHNSADLDKTIAPNSTLLSGGKSLPLSLATLDALPACEPEYTLRNIPMSAGKWFVASDEVALIWPCAAKDHSKLTLHFNNAQVSQAECGMGQIVVYNPGAKK